MKAKHLLVALLALSLITLAVLLALRLDWFVPSPVRYGGEFAFHDGFEDVTSFRALFPEDLSRWHGRQLVPEDATVDVTDEIAHSGKQSLKCFTTAKRNDVTSKADVLREQLHFIKGDHVWSECWFWIKGGASLDHIFLWDLETTHKWQAPGRRVFLQKGGALASDLGKWFHSSVFPQPDGRVVLFPTDRWVRLRVHLFLSENSDGIMQIWQDDVQVIDARGQTLPTAKTVYDRLEVGITANGSTENKHTLYVDDVTISNRPIW